MRRLNLPVYISEVLEKVWQETRPVSIFLYGSQARDDYESDSDFEVGIVYERNNKVPRSQLAEYHSYKNLKLYPFVLEELKEGVIDTPFPKAIYLNSLRDGSKTLQGKEIKEIIKEIEITDMDLMESVGFSLGRAYCAVVSSRQKDMLAVQENFSKAVFYRLQILLILRNKKLVYSYKEMVDEANDLVPEEFKELIKSAVDVRKNITKIELPKLYNAISFLNKVVLTEIRNRC